ncbi:cytochrome C [Helicobacter sp. MIT 00-7814]|uniref:c-type cytochrome n=1 Tax=unclassified Helicobacter TaxID=2593540 RepID=UPI000E1E5EE1|nr:MULTISPECIES: c-type cytochrome [unclassified Helicobacter]RDU51672.1 cytochrome C [Helicobacter sp. MIT 00-7814]RDU52381.1 cytochrome C [Helicobacter sp. MIT 99-10781]
MKKLLLLVFVGFASFALADAPATFKKCVTCHGADGKKTSFGNAAIAGLSKAEVVEDLKGYRAGTLNRHGKANLMKPNAAKLTDAEIDELATYISGLPK